MGNSAFTQTSEKDHYYGCESESMLDQKLDVCASI